MTDDIIRAGWESNTRRLTSEQVRYLRSYDRAHHVPYARLTRLWQVSQPALWSAFARRTYKDVAP